MPEAPVKPGDVLAGKYRVDRVLGTGGMGVVVAATHLELKEPRALKFMLPEALENKIAVERFLREARAAARLHSEHVAHVHDVGRLENGAPYMVMEYLEGADLRSLGRRRGPLPVPLVALYGAQICDALGEAHALGVVHRDLKPANLFVTRRHDGSPCVKVLDFGISKITSATEADIELTATHEIIGSPLFMSPEQLESVRTVDARADIWSLGVVLYALACAKMPFRGENVTEIITAVLKGPPAPPSRHNPDVPAAFDEVVMRCLLRDREQRYATAADLATALRAFVTADDAAAIRLATNALLAERGPSVSSPSFGGAAMRAFDASPLPTGSGLHTPSKLAHQAHATSAPELAAERTGASWGTTSSRPRPSRRALGAALIFGALLIVGLGIAYRASVTRGAAAPPSSSEWPTASVAAAAPVPSSASAAEPPVVAPATGKSAAPANARHTPDATASATASAKASHPAAPPPPARGDSDDDPFGNNRK